MKCTCPHCNGEFELQTVKILKPDEIIEAVSNHFSVTVKQITNGTQVSDVAAARHTAMYLLSTKTGLSKVAIGKMFNRDHTTVIHAVKRAANSFYTKGDLYKHIVTIEAAIN
jgi:chromosomal replication initiator protein